MDNLTLAEKYGFVLPPYRIVKSRKEAVEAGEEIGYPVVLKLISSKITHKTEKGLVKLHLYNEEEIRGAYKELSKYKGKIMVQKMITEGVELLVGGVKDPQFGPMVMVGLGGIYVEIFKDVSARLCPVEEEDIEEMIGELKSHKLIEGARGKRINKKRLKECIKAMCALMSRKEIREAEINPLICTEKECYAVDVRIIRG